MCNIAYQTFNRTETVSNDSVHAVCAGVIFHSTPCIEQICANPESLQYYEQSIKPIELEAEGADCDWKKLQKKLFLVFMMMLVIWAVSAHYN